MSKKTDIHESINYLEFPAKDLNATKIFFCTVFVWKYLQRDIWLSWRKSFSLFRCEWQRICCLDKRVTMTFKQLDIYFLSRQGATFDTLLMKKAKLERGL